MGRAEKKDTFVRMRRWAPKRARRVHCHGFKMTKMNLSGDGSWNMVSFVGEYSIISFTLAY